MKIKFNIKKKVLSQLNGAAPNAPFDAPVYLDTFGSDDFGTIAALHGQPAQKGRVLGCFPLPSRWKRDQSAPVLVEAPTYEQALQLDEKNPTRVVRNRVLRKFPKAKPRGKEAEEGCRICLSPFEHPAEIPCKHVFCRDCINKWLSAQRTCPVCRHEFGEKQTKLVIPK